MICRSASLVQRYTIARYELEFFGVRRRVQPGLKAPRIMADATIFAVAISGTTTTMIMVIIMTVVSAATAMMGMAKTVAVDNVVIFIIATTMSMWVVETPAASEDGACNDDEKGTCEDDNHYLPT